ncbi:unnamed protein product, partial [Ascophyllum nodosum]
RRPELENRDSNGPLRGLADGLAEHSINDAFWRLQWPLGTPYLTYPPMHRSQSHSRPLYLTTRTSRRLFRW